GPAMSATMAIILIERNARVCFKIITRTTITWQASGSENKKQYGNQLFHFLPPYSTDGRNPFFWLRSSQIRRQFRTYIIPTNFAAIHGDRGGNEICVRVRQAGQPMDLHRFWDGLITSSSNL